MPGLLHGCATALRRTLPAALLLAWPPAVYWGLRNLSVRAMAVALLATLLLRVSAGGPLGSGGDRIAIAIAAALALLALLTDAPMPLKLYPVAMNAAMLALFAWSLHRGPAIVERLARLRDPALPPEAIAYCRHVTRAWCLFFVGNGTIALVTALAASDEAWMLYNGFVAYALIGVMAGGEWLVRRRLKRRWTGHG